MVYVPKMLSDYETHYIILLQEMFIAVSIRVCCCHDRDKSSFLISTHSTTTKDSAY